MKLINTLFRWAKRPPSGEQTIRSVSTCESGHDWEEPTIIGSVRSSRPWWDVRQTCKKCRAQQTLASGKEQLSEDILGKRLGELPESVQRRLMANPPYKPEPETAALPVADQAPAPIQCDPKQMVEIPAGSFAMGDTFAEGEPCDGPVHDVFVSTFSIHTCPVSLGYWNEVWKWAVAHGYQFDNPGSGTAPNHPVHSVNWHDCIKWCNALSEMESHRPCYFTTPERTTVYRTSVFEISNGCVDWGADGDRLPTEAEWEKAARAGQSGKRFPWGDTISHKEANYKSEWIGPKPYYPFDVSKTENYHPACPAGGTTLIGLFAPSPNGLFDIAGNVFERCWDWYDEDWYRDPRAKQNDPRGPDSGDGRVNRGGSWHAPARQARVACRWNGSTTKASSNRGFRCVRIAPASMCTDGK